MGVRSISKAHEAAPFVLDVGDNQFSVDYEPGESNTSVFGGNSNWRGPVWMPINYLLVEALYEFEKFYPPEFQVECPTGSGLMLGISEVAAELTKRLTSLFLRGQGGRRRLCLAVTPCSRKIRRFATISSIHEYFHGDTGAGLGAAHQTGWTGLAALLLQPRIRQAGCLIPSTPTAAQA